MTVHGAKGLEAPVVFLADAGPHQDAQRRRLLWLEDKGLPLWRASRDRQDPLSRAAADSSWRRPGRSGSGSSTWR
jgi:ATP-dependent helicase/nuclease subunit A